MRRALPLLLLLSACAAPHHAARQRTGIPDLEPGELLTAEGRRISLPTFVQRARDARFVLLGENHDSACDHESQARLLAAMASTSPALGLEMVDVDRQPVLDRFNSGELGVDELEAALDWSHSWGVPFALYAPVFGAAREHRIPVFALNLPRELVEQVGKDAATADPRLPPRIIPPPDAQMKELRDAFEQHAQMTHAHPGDLDRFVRVQSLWDTQMATAAVARSREHDQRVVVIAGAGHVADGWGIPHRLQVLDPEEAVLSVVPWRGDEAIPEKGADLFVYCPE
jgi:uncharacterized iron-regulated protein